MRVLAVGGNFAGEDGVGTEGVVVGVADFTAGCIAKGEGRLEPAGDGVGDVGDQLAGGGGGDKTLALGGGEPIAVDRPGHDLAVDDNGKGDIDGSLAAVLGVMLRAWRGAPRRGR